MTAPRRTDPARSQHRKHKPTARFASSRSLPRICAVTVPSVADFGLAPSALPPRKRTFRLFIDRRSCQLELSVPEQAAEVRAVMELSEVGKVSECVFSALPFWPTSPYSCPSSSAPGHRALPSSMSLPRSISRSKFRRDGTAAHCLNLIARTTRPIAR